MKRIIILITLVIYCGLLSAQTGTGWSQQRSKVNFKDSLYITKDIRIKVPLRVLGATSGTVTIQAPAIAGTTTQTLPLSTGMLINSADTATMLAPYIHVHDTSNMLAPYIQRSDTSGMLTNYITINESESLIQDSIQRNAINTSDYYIYGSGGTFYAVPHPKSSYTNKSAANVTTVIQHAMDQLTTGGKIYIAKGSYTDVDTIIVQYDGISLEGAGAFGGTALKAKANIDAGKTQGQTYGFIQVICKDNFTIRNIELDGNGTNQTYSGAQGRFHGLYFYVLYGVDTDTCNYPLVENCYIHDFPGAAGCVMLAKNGVIRNSYFVDNYSNGITSYGLNNVIESCYAEGSGDVGITMFGQGVIQGNYAKDNDGALGTSSTQWGIGIEGTTNTPKKIDVINNKIIGNHKVGIGVYSNARDCNISGNDISRLYNASGTANGIVIDEGYGVNVTNNYIHDWNDSGVGIVLTNDTLTNVSGNKIVKMTTANSYGVTMAGSYLSSVIGNDIRTAGGGAGIYVNTDYCNVIGNNVYGVTGIDILSNAENNKILNNICTGTAGAAFDLRDQDGDNIRNNNYGITTGAFLPNTGANSLTMSGADVTTFNTTANTDVTLPTSGTLATIGNINATRDSIEFGVFNILDYGAISDDGNEDATAIQAAINAAADVSSTTGFGGTVKIPAGKWYITKPDTLKSSVYIVCDGGAYFYFPNGYSGKVWVSPEDERLYDAGIDGGYYYQATYPGAYTWLELDSKTYDYNIYNCHFKNVTIDRSGKGIFITTHSTGWVTSCTFDNIWLQNPVIGIDFTEHTGTYGTDGHIFSNIVFQAGNGLTAAIDTIPGNNNQFECMFWDYGAYPTVPVFTFGSTAYYNVMKCSGISASVLWWDYGNYNTIIFDDGVRAEKIIPYKGGSDDSKTAYLEFNRTGPTATKSVDDGDVLGTIDFKGYYTSAYYSGAQIKSTISGTPGATDMPAKIELATSADGSATPTTRLTIGADGVSTFAGSVALGSNTLTTTGLSTLGDVDIVSGYNLYTPVKSTGTIDPAVGITDAMLSTYMRHGTSAPIDITANPQIANPSTGEGTTIMIMGSTDANYLKLDDGNGIQLAQDQSCILGFGDFIILNFNSYLDDWTEVCRSEPNGSVSIKKYTIGLYGATGVDYTLNTNDADQDEYVITMTSALPAKCRIIAAEIVCVDTLESSAGAVDITFELGTTSSGAEYIAAASCDDNNEVVGIIDATKPAAVTMNYASAKNLYLTGDPDQNWDTLTDGDWIIYLTYINYIGR